jgi:pimeloyl-ACP methyl ester carboxylesterase
MKGKGRNRFTTIFVLTTAMSTSFAENSPPQFVRVTIETDGARLSCLHRPGEGIPLVLIPGTFSDSSAWFDVVSHLDPRRPIVLIEMRGQGESWPPMRNGTIERLAEDVFRVLENLGISRYYVGGHSLGGMVSLEIGRVRPEDIAGIVSVEGWTNFRAAKEAFGYDMTSTLSEEQLAKRLVARERVLSRWTQEQKDDFGTAWRKWNGYSFLCRTHLPILEVYGDRGKARPPRESLHIPERENIQLLWIENASHSLALERPKALAEAMTAFMTRLEAKDR